MLFFLAYPYPHYSLTLVVDLSKLIEESDTMFIASYYEGNGVEGASVVSNKQT